MIMDVMSQKKKIFPLISLSNVAILVRGSVLFNSFNVKKTIEVLMPKNIFSFPSE